MNESTLQGKKALITGASSGLGFAMAKALAQAGASVAITARKSDKLDKALAQLKEQQLDAYALEMDVRDEHSIEKAVQWVRQQWGKLDLLVNNAGIGMRTVNPDFLTKPQPFYQVSAAGFRDLIDTNLTGYFLVAKAFVPLFLEQGKGKIVNISMNHETMKRKGFVPYGPSRAGTDSLSHIMAEDLKEYHVDVNMLLPGGATETGMIPEQAKEEIKSRFRLLDPDVMATPIIFLASDESSGITGERITATTFDSWRSSLATKK
ncbi:MULTISPECIES: SDR family NAD(P)-dependent oxidoreductase [Pontibacter]|uniref:Gluconate 5-dehydrogenase n=1 Tax=Pontibacter virosus TaxID=1765052 RepID=A0A2U1APS4_9BACT|nr:MULTISPECIES: SDR family oxidoreductase [Pontibacter]MCJ8165971.1 SDR family oxidoreductase [Pontibacter sp. E15-1]PVY38368.1 gluconate 5-dehydrogenase [Pontibacter virosus]